MEAYTEIPPSPWVARFARLPRPGGAVLDVACGRGRHARLLAALGYRVTAVDRNADALASMARAPGIETIEADLEDGRANPFAFLGGRNFAAVIVTNYLYRPLLEPLSGLLAPGAFLIYETFAAGNARYGRPRNPEFLLNPGELLTAFPGLRVLAFEDGLAQRPQFASLQRICAVRAADDLAGGGTPYPLFAR